jgi:hypothetical protein
MKTLVSHFSPKILLGQTDKIEHVLLLNVRWRIFQNKILESCTENTRRSYSSFVVRMLRQNSIKIKNKISLKTFSTNKI